MIISNYMKNEHRECDTLFASAEEKETFKKLWQERVEKILLSKNNLITITKE